MFNLGLPTTLFSQHYTADFVGDEELTINEKLAISQFSDKRLKDFSTGRYCAHKALAAMGYENAEILIGDKKQPIWPVGYVGSISHSSQIAGAVVGNTSQFKSIGLDIETIGKIKTEMWRMLYTRTETEFLNNVPIEELPYYTTLLFSCKEAFYKLQFPLTKTFLEFTDVEVKKFGNGLELHVLKEFEEKKLLPDIISLYHVQEKNQVLTLCYLT